VSQTAPGKRSHKLSNPSPTVADFNPHPWRHVETSTVWVLLGASVTLSIRCQTRSHTRPSLRQSRQVHAGDRYRDLTADEIGKVPEVAELPDGSQVLYTRGHLRRHPLRRDRSERAL
jgi:hypothetical protein